MEYNSILCIIIPTCRSSEANEDLYNKILVYPMDEHIQAGYDHGSNKGNETQDRECSRGQEPAYVEITNNIISEE